MTPPRPAPSLSISPPTLTLAVGSTASVSATKHDDDSGSTVTYESSDPTVATVGVPSGLVSAVKVGTATITARAGSLSAQSAVTVVAA